MTTILPIVGPAPRTPEWFALRRYDPERKERPVVIGATMAAGCCGVSPYNTPLDVFVELLLGRDREPTEAMLAGLDFEDAALNIYERKRKPQLRSSLQRKMPMFFHGKYPWMGATPDAIAHGYLAGGEDGTWGVDAKTSTYRRLDKEGGDPLKFGRDGTDELPCDYLMQGQAQCEVLNLPYVEFPVLFSRDFCPIYRVTRDEQLISLIIKAEMEMFQRLQNNDPPEPNWEHENTRELISLLHGKQKGKSIELGEEELERWLLVQRKADEVKQLEEEIRAEKNRLLFKLGDAECGVFPSGGEQLKRISVKQSLWTEKDIDDARANLGTQKRAGFEYIRQTKVEA